MQMYKAKRNNFLRNLKLGSVALVAAGVIAAPVTYADNSASAYWDGGLIGAAAMSANSGAQCDDAGFCKVLATELKNSGTPKDLVIGVSFETLLMTETVVKSKGGNRSESVADAKIVMKVFVDGTLANPGDVIFDRREQTLWASLGGVLDCTDLNGDGIVSFDECTLTDEEIGLALDTAQASTFNFLSYDIGSGSHTIEVWAQLYHNGQVVEGDGSAAASAMLGKGTVSVWEVHGSTGN